MTRALRAIVVAVALAWPLPCPAQDDPAAPTIHGPGPTVAAHRLARFEVVGEATGVLWEVTPLTGDFAERGRPVDTEPPDGRGKALAFPGPPGKYRVAAFAVVGGEIARLKPVTVTIFAGPDGPPDDDPGPDPPPPDDDELPAVSPMRTAGRAYSQGNSDVLRNAGRWLRANPTATKSDLIKWMAPRRADVGGAFNRALDAAIDRHADEAGKFTDPTAAAKALDEAGRGVGSP